jgi:sugar phosphate isomerase/epimerase
MQLGVMNDPRVDPHAELRWAIDNGFDFLDLTVEGPAAALENLDLPRLREMVVSSGISIVGHTAPYLPFASPVARLRRAAIECVVDTFELFATLGTRWINVHLAQTPKLFSSEQWLAWNAESFSELADRAAAHDLRIMVEHPPRPSVGVSDIGRVLHADERLGFHLDIGHAFVGGDKLDGLIKAFGNRIAHVHVSDNRGSFDDHRTLGDGWIDWPRAIRLLRSTGYDGTITLEVQSPDREYVLLSARKLRQWWDQAA